jgi:branched-chain amino acid transport system substrate-binding protein
MPRSIGAAAGCILACLLSSCVSPQLLRETSPVRIGLYADLSSTGALEGNDALRGAELRVDQANASGGVGGRQVELVVIDAKQSSAEAVKSFTHLAQEDGVCAVIGSSAAASSLSVSPVADLSRVSLISLAVDDRVTTPELRPENPEEPGAVRRFSFLVQPSAIQSASAFAEYCIERFTAGRYATLFDPVNPVSVLQARAFESVVRKSGKVVAASVALPEGDPGAALRLLRDESVEAVYICASSEKNEASARAVREVLPLAIQLGNAAWYEPVAGAAAVSDNAWFSMPVSPDDPGLADIAPAYVAKFGEKPRPGMVPGWDAAGLILAAVRKAGSSGPLKVRDAIEQMTAFRALPGLLDMDRKTHRPVLLPVAIMRITGGACLTAEARWVHKRAPGRGTRGSPTP